MFMVSGNVYTHNLTRAKHYLERCLEIVLRNDIWIVPRRGTDDLISSSTLELTEENRERAVLLGQVVYWNSYIHLLDGNSEEN